MKTSRTSLMSILAVLVVLALAIGSRMAVWNSGDHASGTSQAIGGAFTLINGDGQTVSDQDFRSKWMLIYFGYTFCPDVCPTSLSLMSEALDKLPADRQKMITPVFITVDPARDTAAVVKDYVAAFRPDMIGLTGSQDQVAAMMRNYKVYAARAKGDDPAHYTVDHSSILYLVGPDGRFVAHFAHGTNSSDIAAALGKYLK